MPLTFQPVNKNILEFPPLGKSRLNRRRVNELDFILTSDLFNGLTYFKSLDVFLKALIK